MKYMMLLLAAVLLSMPGMAGSERVTVISHNVHLGFDAFQSKVPVVYHTKEMMDRFVTFMKDRDPDILCLQELCTRKGHRFTDAKLKDLAARYGHGNSVFLPIGYGLGITSKYPIEVVTKHAGNGFGHGFIHVRIRGLNVIVTHLSPRGYRYRLSEAEFLRDYIRRNCSERCLIMGDFNARSPFDADLLARHTLQKEIPYEELPDRNDYSVLSSLMSVPLVDTVRQFVPTEQRSTCPIHLDLKRCGERIDYILATPDLSPYLQHALIWNGENPYNLRWISDHAPNELWLKPSVLR